MSKKYPPQKALNFVVCEDLRSETGGKYSIMGIYPGGQIVLHTDASKKPGKIKGRMRILFVSMIHGGEGKFPCEWEIISPDKSVVRSGKFENIELGPNRGSILGAGLQNFEIPEYGKYTFVLKLGEKSYERYFTIERVDRE